MKNTIPERYEVNSQDKAVIDVSIKTIEDLFSNFDMNARNKLDQEFANYIIDCVNEIEGNEFVIQITSSNVPEEKIMEQVQNSIQSYFSYLKDSENRSIEIMFGRSFKLFGLGLVLLFFAIVLNRHFLPGEGTISQVFSEGITIAAWVSLWAAFVNIFVKWPPHTKNIKLYERIMKAKVIFRN